MASALARWSRRAARAGETSRATAELCVLLGLTGFALTQPLLALLGEEPTWFTFRGADRTQIVVFALVVALGPPLVLWAVTMLLRRARRGIGWWFHLAVVGGLAGLTALEVARRRGLSTAALVVVGVLAGIGFMVAYAGAPAVRLWSRYTAILTPLTLGSFLLLSPTGDLLTADATTAAVSASDRPSVLLLMLDELPTQSLLDDGGGIDRVRYPHLAELADSGTWYPSYTTPAARTPVALPSILSSTEPTVDAATYVNHPDTLFSLLAPTHDMRVFETVTDLCDPATCPDLGRDASEATQGVVAQLLTDAADVWHEGIAPPPDERLLDDFAPELEANEADDTAAGPDDGWVNALPEVQVDFLRSIEPVDVPTLWYLHLLLPHQPWRLYPDGTEYTNPPIFDSILGSDRSPWLNAVTEQRHLLQLQYADALVGLTVDALREAGEYDDTVIVVTADHGIAFQSGVPARAPTRDNLVQLAYAPLIVKGPSGEPASPGSNVLSDDLLPTIAEMVDVEVPWDVRGEPIGSPAQRSRSMTKPFYDYGPDLRPSLHGILEFEHRDGVPTIDDRWVGSIQPGDDPIAGLLDIVGADEWLGRSIDSVAAGGEPVAQVRIEAADQLRDPGSIPPGFVVANLAGDVRAGDVALLELNGTIVTAAPLSTPSGERAKAYLMLPPGQLDASGNGVRLAVLRDGAVLPTADR